MTSSKSYKIRVNKHIWALFGLAVCSAGCEPAHGGDPTFWAPYAGGGGASEATTTTTGAASSGGGNGPSGGGGGGSGGGAPVSTGGLVFQFTTASLNGKYAPKNIVAVWITDSNGAFVKTLDLRAAKRAEHLVAWNADTNANIVDAVTGATRKAHGPYESKWDGTNVSGGQVADGEYHVNVEFTEWNSSDSGKAPGPMTAVTFLRGSMKQDITVPDVSGITGIHLVYEP